MRNKAADIAWKFANRLRDKYSSHRVVTAMITYVYISWEAKSREVINDDPSYLINKALDEFGNNFDEKQLQVFRKSIDLLKNEVEDLFYDDFFTHLKEADTNELKELLAFLIKRTREIDSDLNDFTNTEISTLFANSIDQNSYKRILDPCIGSAGLLVELAESNSIDPKEATVHGVEKEPRASLIAYINLKINGFKDFSITTDDVLNQELSNDYYDLIISDLPLGVHLRDRSFGGEEVSANWRFYHLLFQKSLGCLASDGDIYFSASRHMVAELNNDIQKDQGSLPIFENDRNYIQKLSQIIDASSVAQWSFTATPFYIISFRGEFIEDLEICKIQGNKGKDSIQISKSKWSAFDHINDPTFFFTETFKTLSDKFNSELLSLDEYFENAILSERKARDLQFALEANEDKILLWPSDLTSRINGWKRISPEELGKVQDLKKERKRANLKSPGSWLLIFRGGKINLAILETDSPVLVPMHFGAIIPKEDLTIEDEKWLIAQILSDFVQDQIRAMVGNAPTHIPTRSLLKDVKIQKQSEQEKKEFLDNWQEQRIEELEEEKEKIEQGYQDVVKKKEQKKLSEEFDLIHDLQHTLKNDVNSIKSGITSIKKYLKQKEVTGENIDLNEPINEQRSGADPKLNDTVRERFDMLDSVTESMSKLLKNYKEILRFDPKKHDKQWIELRDFFEKYGKGHERFNFEVREVISLEEEKRDREYYKLYADPEVLRLVFQNMISNAIDHGFTKKEKKYSILVEIKDSSGDKKKYDTPYGEEEFADWFLNIIIKNDGEPILDKTTKENFFTRGASSGGSGLGGYHIKRGVESMGGEIELLEPEADDPYQTQLLMKFRFTDVVFKSPNSKTIRTFSR